MHPRIKQDQISSDATKDFYTFQRLDLVDQLDNVDQLDHVPSLDYIDLLDHVDLLRNLFTILKPFAN